MNARDKNFDVILAGAGPVGLFLSTELALKGCRVLVLEKSEENLSPLKKLPFGLRGLNSPSVESFYRRGLLAGLSLHERMSQPHSASTTESKAPAKRLGGHFAGIPFEPALIDPSQWPFRMASSLPTVLLSEMAEVETVLRARAQELGVTVLFGQAAQSISQSAEEVTVKTESHTYHARWLVGCDGARSAVRKAGGFEFVGTEPEFTGYSVLADIADPEKLKPGRNVTAKGMYLQSQPGYLILQDFDGGAFHAAAEPVTQTHFQNLLRRISGTDVTVNALHLATTWTDRSRQAHAYRNGRILLAGDAAHIHSPLGGQGLNLGLGDAMNLGWKLAATIQGKAPSSLLDSYQSERHPLGQRVLDWSRAQVSLMRPGPASQAMKAIVEDLIHTKDGASYFAARVSGVNIRYDLGNPHPLVGQSAPNFSWENSDLGQEMRTGEGVLLDFEGKPELAKAASPYGSALKYFSVKPKDTLGLNALLIRPDGIVAWVSQRDEASSSMTEAADRWFLR